MQIRLGERLVDTGLIGAERTAALQQQGNALEWRTISNAHASRRESCEWSWRLRFPAL